MHRSDPRPNATLWLGLLCTLGALVCAVILFAGCSSVAVGPVAVLSDGLGYERGYLGAQVTARGERGGWLVEGEAQALTATKTGSLEGGAYTGSLLAGRRSGAWSLLAGVRGARQHADTWDKEILQPVVVACWTPRRVAYGITWAGPDSNGEIRSAWGLTLDALAPRARTPGLSLRLESVDWRQGEIIGRGYRAAMALLWGMR